MYFDHKEFLSVAREILEGGKRMSFHARGSSMSPFIRDGDTVIVAPAKDPLAVGDIILFRAAEGRALLHRVIKNERTAVITQGDASCTDDGLVPRENILGRVVKVSGRGYNFHLRQPFKFLIGRRIFFSRKLYRFRFVLKFGRKIADVLG